MERWTSVVLRVSVAVLAGLAASAVGATALWFGGTSP
jgi:hypothetical protein